MTTPPIGRCHSCQQTRPLFTFSWVPIGWMEFVEAQLCARCHSAATIEDDTTGLDYDVFSSRYVIVCTRCKQDDGPFTDAGLCEACARPMPLGGVA